MNTLVSVIMPAFNAEKFIADAIESVIKQTYTHWELIIIDDGSTDGTSTIVKEYLTSEGRIKYIYQDNNGQGRARNNGISHARGEFIAFLDADDLWIPEKLQVQMQIMSAEKTDLLFSDAYIFEDKPVSEKKMGVTHDNYKGDEAVHRFLYYNHIPILTVLTKKSALEKVNGFSEKPEIQNAEDYHLWIRMLIQGYSFLGIDASLAHYRIHNASATAGEGKIIFPTLNCLKQIATSWPQYSMEISRSMYSLINNHLTKVNISRWDVADRLLETRNSLFKENVSISFWKGIYFLFGKDVFRILFNLKTKKRSEVPMAKMQNYTERKRFETLFLF